MGERKMEPGRQVKKQRPRDGNRVILGYNRDDRRAAISEQKHGTPGPAGKVYPRFRGK